MAFPDGGETARLPMLDYFINGLANLEVRSLTDRAKPRNGEEALKAALEAEAHVFWIKNGSLTNREGKPIRAVSDRGASNGGTGTASMDQRASREPKAWPHCFELGCEGILKPEECRRRNVRRFGCSKVGHMKRYCPNPGSPRATSPSPARNGGARGGGGLEMR